MSDINIKWAKSFPEELSPETIAKIMALFNEHAGAVEAAYREGYTDCWNYPDDTADVWWPDSDAKALLDKGE